MDRQAAKYCRQQTEHPLLALDGALHRKFSTQRVKLTCLSELNLTLWILHAAAIRRTGSWNAPVIARRSEAGRRKAAGLCKARVLGSMRTAWQIGGCNGQAIRVIGLRYRRVHNLSLLSRIMIIFSLSQNPLITKLSYGTQQLFSSAQLLAFTTGRIVTSVAYIITYRGVSNLSYRNRIRSYR